MSQPRSPQATSPGFAAALKPSDLLSIRICRVVLDAERGVPAAVNAVELEQMRGRRRAALDLVQMHDIEAIVGARIAVGAAHAAHRRAQRKSSHAAHAVDADTHDFDLPQGAVRTVSPISSSRFLSAMRSSDANGRLVKISSRRRTMA